MLSFVLSSHLYGEIQEALHEEIQSFDVDESCFLARNWTFEVRDAYCSSYLRRRFFCPFVFVEKTEDCLACHLIFFVFLRTRRARVVVPFPHDAVPPPLAFLDRSIDRSQPSFLVEPYLSLFRVDEESGSLTNTDGVMGSPSEFLAKGKVMRYGVDRGGHRACVCVVCVVAASLLCLGVYLARGADLGLTCHRDHGRRCIYLRDVVFWCCLVGGSGGVEAKWRQSCVHV